MAYPYTMTKIGGAGVSMATKKGQDVVDPTIDNVTEIATQIPSFAFSSFTAGVVVNDANASNSFTPTSGTNPTLGSGSSTVGRYFRIGDLVVANFAVHFGSSGVSEGAGTYRIRIPVQPAATLYNTNAVIGWGHIIDADAPNTVFGLGPGNHKHVSFHVTSAVNNQVAGIVIGTNSLSIAPNYTLTNHSDDRVMDETAPTGTYAESIAEETRHVLGTLIADIDASRGAGTALDNVSAGIPQNWSADDAIIGCLMYEAA